MERVRMVKRLTEIAAFLKSSHPPRLKQDIMNDINTKNIMDVMCPSTAIPVPRATTIPRKVYPSKKVKKQTAT